MSKGKFETLEECRNYILYLIINNRKKRIEKFLNKKEITFSQLVSLKDIDILIFSIENNASLSMIKYVIKEYSNLNYTFDFKLMGIKSPLFSAIMTNKFGIADILIENGADINYEVNYLNILYYLDSHHRLNKENLKYIINNGFDINNNIDSYLINTLSDDMVEIIFKYTLFNNKFILKLIRLGKKKIPISNQILNMLIENQCSQIYIENSWYMKAIERDDYRKLSLFLKNDYNEIDETELLDHGHIIENKELSDAKIFGLYDNYDAKYHIDKKYKFIEKIDDRRYDFDIDKKIIKENSIPFVDKVREDVKNLIINGDKDSLNFYLIENKIKLKELNTSDFDILLYAIENTGISDRDMEIILHLTNFYIDNIELQIKRGGILTIPAIPVLRKERFKTAEILIIKKRNLFFKFV